MKLNGRELNASEVQAIQRLPVRTVLEFGYGTYKGHVHTGHGEVRIFERDNDAYFLRTVPQKAAIIDPTPEQIEKSDAKAAENHNLNAKFGMDSDEFRVYVRGAHAMGIDFHADRVYFEPAVKALATLYPVFVEEFKAEYPDAEFEVHGIARAHADRVLAAAMEFAKGGEDPFTGVWNIHFFGPIQFSVR